MPGPHIELDSVTDTDRFVEALNALLRTGYENDVTLERTFACRNGSQYPDWEVLVSRVQKPPGECAGDRDGARGDSEGANADSERA